MRYLSFFVVFLMLSSCNDDDFSPDGILPCDGITNGWTAESAAYSLYHYPQEIAFGSPNVAVSVSRGGLIGRSTDGGVNWELVDSYVVSAGVRNEDAVTSAWLRTVEAVNDNLFYAAGNDEDARRSTGDIETDAVFLTSRDGGMTWSKRYLEGFKTIFDLCFQDENRGFAVASLNEQTEDPPRWLFTTEDGGITWTPVDFPLVWNRLSFRFVEGSTEVSIVAETEDESPVLLKLSGPDGSWEAFVLPEDNFGAIQFTNNDVGFFRGSGNLWMTTDGGVNWAQKEIGEATGYARLYAADEENWLAIRPFRSEPTGQFEDIGDLLYYEVLTTNNAGESWAISKVDKECNYDLQHLVLPTRTPDGGFLSVTSRANLIKFGN